MTDKIPVFQTNLDHLVQSIGHLILVKVDPAARERNLIGQSIGKGTAHESPNPRWRRHGDPFQDGGARYQ